MPPTTALRTLASELTAEDDITALMFSCERAKAAADDYAAAESLLLDSLRQAAEWSGWPDELLPPDPWPQVTPGTGTSPDTDTAFDDDISYVHDLGLIRGTRDLEIANPIYREVLLRALGARTERFVMADPHSFVLPDGRFDLGRLLEEFVVFWREHGEVLIRQEGYHEAACQIILMAFLHRLVNGGGHLDREYAAGTKRLDVLVRWPYPGPDGERLMQREAMELKVWRAGETDPLGDGLAQLDRYLDRLTLPTGVLVIFDRRPEALPWKERGGFEQATTPSGRHITVLRV